MSHTDVKSTHVSIRCTWQSQSSYRATRTPKISNLRRKAERTKERTTATSANPVQIDSHRQFGALQLSNRRVYRGKGSTRPVTACKFGIQARNVFEHEIGELQNVQYAHTVGSKLSPRDVGGVFDRCVSWFWQCILGAFSKTAHPLNVVTI